MFVIKDHKIDGIDYIPSPNCEERPKNLSHISLKDGNINQKKISQFQLEKPRIFTNSYLDY